METVTLYSEDFKTVHNTLCELRSVQQRLTGVISNELADQLHSVIRGFEQGLKNAYDQDNAAFETKHDLYHGIQQHWRFKSIWSIYEVEDFEAQHPFKDAAYVIYDQHWGERGEVVRKIESEGAGHGTWIDLWRAADAAIQASGDQHHIFIEHFEPVADKPHHLRLTTGS